MLPIVSIAMATFNGEKYLDEQIGSLINQDYEHLEIVIVDDCSTDNTWEKLKDWQLKYPEKIKIFRNEKNLGFNQNFSKAISLCKGKYIAISDQDDIWALNKISKLVGIFENDPEIMLIHHKDDHLIDGKIHKQIRDKYYWTPYSGNNPRPLFLNYRMGGHSMMFNSKINADLLPMPLGILYDWWILMLSVSMGKVFYCSDDLVHFRFHGESAYFGNKDRNRNLVNEIKHALGLFKNIQGFKTRDKEFLKKFSEHYTRHADKYMGRFDFRLFVFYLKHRKDFFGVIGAPNRAAREIYILRMCRVYAKQ
jgi:glycosyltransferase involved in cell wall biosynthesis